MIATGIFLSRQPHYDVYYDDDDDIIIIIIIIIINTNMK
jgi:hypothetical protein